MSDNVERRFGGRIHCKWCPHSWGCILCFLCWGCGTEFCVICHNCHTLDCDNYKPCNIERKRQFKILTDLFDKKIREN